MLAAVLLAAVLGEAVYLASLGLHWRNYLLVAELVALALVATTYHLATRTTEATAVATAPKRTTVSIWAWSGPASAHGPPPPPDAPAAGYRVV